MAVRAKEIIHVKCSAYCLAHIKETTNVTYFIMGTQYIVMKD